MARSVGFLEWDLTEDIIEELLFHDMDDDNSNANTSGPARAAMPAPSSRLRTSADIMSCINTTATLSPLGKEHVQQWIENFSKSQQSSVVIQHYPLLCQDAGIFFNEAMSRHEAPKLLLDVMNAVAKPPKNDFELVCGKVGTYENETLEYIGGYTLKKAYCRFSKKIINSLCSYTPQGSLISLMERKTGALLYPSEEYLYFLQFIYMKFTKEGSRNYKEIQEVLNSQYFRSLADRVYDMCEDEVTQDDVEGAISYVVNLMIHALSHSFSRKLFQRLHKKVTSGATSLRDQQQGMEK